MLLIFLDPFGTKVTSSWTLHWFLHLHDRILTKFAPLLFDQAPPKRWLHAKAGCHSAACLACSRLIPTSPVGPGRGRLELGSSRIHLSH